MIQPKHAYDDYAEAYLIREKYMWVEAGPIFRWLCAKFDSQQLKKQMDR